MAKGRIKRKNLRKVRKLGDILLDLEAVTLELLEHELQWGDILNLQRGYLEVHAPGAQEEYLDGTKPEFYYGPKRT